MNHIQETAPRPQRLVVRDLAEVEYLIKEAEILTGTPGRTFVVAGLRGRRFVIRLEAGGYHLDARDDGGMQVHAEFVRVADWPRHRMARAVRAGRLLTAEVDR